MGIKLALIQAPCWGVACAPYGLAVLKSFVESRGHQAAAYDLNLELYRQAGKELQSQWAPDRHQFWLEPSFVRGALEGELAPAIENWLARLAAWGPRVAGFSCLFSNEQAALYLARRVRERLPRCLVVFGGPQASRMAEGERILSSGAVDYLVEGEGEETLTELLEAVEAGRDPARVLGVVSQREGRLEAAPRRALMRDISGLPVADYSDFPMADYQEPGCIPVSLSRGCPNECAFCYEVQYWDRFRARKAASLIEEVRRLKSGLARVDWLWFHDSLINGHMGELRAFASGLIEQGLQTRWASQAVIRPEMTREVLQLLKDSGAMSLNYGLESASFTIMLKMGKKLAKNADLDAIVRDTREVGIDCILNFMFGFPGESEEDFQESLDFVARNKSWITMVQPSPGFCDFYKGTLAHQDPEKFGIELREGSAHWVAREGENTYLTRMKRFERFLEHVHGLGVKCSYPDRRLYLRETIIGNYYYTYGPRESALPHYRRAFREDPVSRVTLERFIEVSRRSGRYLDWNLYYALWKRRRLLPAG